MHSIVEDNERNQQCLLSCPCQQGSLDQENGRVCSPATPRANLLDRSYAKLVADSLKAKKKTQNKARALHDLEHVHVNPLFTWSQLTKRDKKHLMLCNECSEPFFNNTPNGKIRSVLLNGPSAGDVYSTPLYLMRDDMIQVVLTDSSNKNDSDSDSDDNDKDSRYDMKRYDVKCRKSSLFTE